MKPFCFCFFPSLFVNYFSSLHQFSPLLLSLSLSRSLSLSLFPFSITAVDKNEKLIRGMKKSEEEEETDLFVVRRESALGKVAKGVAGPFWSSGFVFSEGEREGKGGERELEEEERKERERERGGGKVMKK